MGTANVEQQLTLAFSCRINKALFFVPFLAKTWHSFRGYFLAFFISILRQMLDCGKIFVKR